MLAGVVCVNVLAHLYVYFIRLPLKVIKAVGRNEMGGLYRVPNQTEPNRNDKMADHIDFLRQRCVLRSGVPPTATQHCSLLYILCVCLNFLIKSWLYVKKIGD